MEKANELMKYKNINKEELLLIPQDFPYVMKAIDFSDFRNCFVPWHWHNEIEIFYMKSGGIEYYLPGGRVNFPAGTAGIINSNVLHKTRPYFGVENSPQHQTSTTLLGLVRENRPTPLLPPLSAVFSHIHSKTACRGFKSFCPCQVYLPKMMQVRKKPGIPGFFRVLRAEKGPSRRDVFE